MVFYEALLHVGKNYEFISDAALLTQEFFSGLG